MSTARSYVKPGSRAPWLSVLTLGAVALASVGCVVVHDDMGRPGEWEDPPGETPMLVGIDADQTLTQTPGEGVGLFVEYMTGGHWRVWTTCDSASGSPACGFAACVSVPGDAAGIERAGGEDLELDDSVVAYGDGVTCLEAFTDLDTDGMSFDAPPGAVVRLEMALDGYSRPEFVFWVGDGIVHAGAPTNPVEFEPSSP